MEREISFWDICDAIRRNDEEALSDLSLLLAAERVRATGARTCGIVKVAKAHGTWESVRRVLRSARFGHILLNIQFVREDAAEPFEEIVALVPGFDAAWVDRLARHGATVVIADAVDREGFVEAISRLHPGWQIDGFDLPPSCFIEALGEVVTMKGKFGNE